MTPMCSPKAKAYLNNLGNGSEAFAEIEKSIQDFMKAPRFSPAGNATRRTRRYVICLSQYVDKSGKPIVCVEYILSRQEFFVERLRADHKKKLRLFSRSIGDKISRRIDLWGNVPGASRRQRPEPLSIEVRTKTYSYTENAILSGTILRRLSR